MFGILLLLAAAFSGHEVVSGTESATSQAAAVPQVVVVAPAQPDVGMAPVPPVVRVADNVAQPVASDALHPSADDSDIDAALDRVSDFYDTTPPAPAAKARRTAATGAQPQGAARPALGPHLVSTRTDYASDGRPVVVDIVRPDDDERRPAVLILHGASGIGDGAFYRSAAELFAEHGYVTFLPHYLEAARATTSKSHAKTAKSSRAHEPEGAPGSIRAGFPQQEQILRDAVDYAAHSPYVDSSRIGVFGLSLGGFHALTLSSRDERIAAVVDMSGALRGNVIPETNHLAPTLELHGAHDPIVPVARARALAGTLKQLGVPYELKIYPAQGHFLRGKAQEDAMERATSFFATYLTPADSSRAAQQSGGGAE
jgi:carboxymethylenebutenolidase